VTARKLGLFALLLLLLGLAVAEARPGGGHSSSGGGRSSSSSRSSGGGGSFRGGGGSGGSLGGGGAVALIVIFVLIMIISAVVKQGQAQDNWSSGNIAYTPPPPKPVSLAPLIQRDPEFSRAVFEDFVYELYAAAQRSRDNPAKLGALSAYLDPGVIGMLAARGAAPSQIVIGSVKLANVATNVEGNLQHVDVRIEATVHTEPPRYVTELWSFVRELSAVSKPPTRNRTWGCPNCGAPWVANATRTCGHCNEPMGAGRFDWTVRWLQVESSKPVLASLRGTVEEYGNHLATVRAPDVDHAMASINVDDPAVSFDTIRMRTIMIYQRLNEAWNANDLKKVRGLVTTSLRGYLAYWLDEYKRQGLANRLDNARVETIHLSSVTRDKHYDAITLRVFAGGADYTLEGNRVVGGSKSTVRHYTEYWTLIRSSARRGAVVTEPKCANCGAPLEDTSDSGECSHCQANNELGSFDWVLSKIEQDDNYVG
jgi:hypothetical protein